MTNTEPVNDPANKKDHSGLTPNQRAMINDGIVIGANVVGVALTFAGAGGTGPVLAGIGSLLFQSFAPGKSPQAAYYQALSQQIAQMEGVLLTELSAISQQIKGLQTELTELAVKLALEIDLNVYNQSKAVIDQYYSDLVDLLADVSGKQDIQNDAGQLFSLFQDHADDVAIQMQLLHDTLLDGADNTAGLISQQRKFVALAVENWVADAQNYTMGRQTYGRNTPFEAFRCADIINKGYAAAAGGVIQNFVQPFINSNLTLQYRGLTFLTTAWAKSEYTDQLQKHVDNAKDIIKAIENLINFLTDPAVIDATIKSAIAKSGFRRTPSSLSGNDHGEHFVDLNNLVPWDGWSMSGFGAAGRWGGPVLKILNAPNDFAFNRSYPTWTLYPTDPHGPWRGWQHAVHSQTYVPAPSSLVPKPLTAGFGVTSSVLTQTLAQTSGPQIVLRDVPPAKGGTISGQVLNLANAGTARVNVFEYVGGIWNLQASDVALGADGSFSTTAAGNAAVFWSVLVVKPGWTWTGASTHAAPDIGPDVLAYITTPPTG